MGCYKECRPLQVGPWIWKNPMHARGEPNHTQELGQLLGTRVVAQDLWARRNGGNFQIWVQRRK